MKSFIKEFKEFISRGSVMDLAVGVIIGSAFTAIVTSLVDNIIMPLVGIIIGGIDFSSLKITIGSPVGGNPAVLSYGLFIQNLINFVLIALTVFIIIKAINKFRSKKEEEEAPVVVPEDVALLTEIRDLLKDKK